MEKALTRWFRLHNVADEAPKTDVIWLPANFVVSKRPANVLWTHSHGLQLEPDLAAMSISHFLLHPALSAHPSYSTTGLLTIAWLHLRSWHLRLAVAARLPAVWETSLGHRGPQGAGQAHVISTTLSARACYSTPLSPAPMGRWNLPIF